MDLGKAHKIINDLSVSLKEDDGVSFYDSKRLPHPRDEIVFALLLGLKFLPDTRNDVQAALTALARYQDGVGPEPLSPPALSAEDLVGMLKATASGRRSANETERLIDRAAETVDDAEIERLSEFRQSYEEKRSLFLSMAERVV